MHDAHHFPFRRVFWNRSTNNFVEGPSRSQTLRGLRDLTAGKSRKIISDYGRCLISALYTTCKYTKSATLTSGAIFRRLSTVHLGQLNTTHYTLVNIGFQVVDENESDHFFPEAFEVFSWIGSVDRMCNLFIIGLTCTAIGISPQVHRFPLSNPLKTAFHLCHQTRPDNPQHYSPIDSRNALHDLSPYNGPCRR
jgi:hypothetical protein